MKRSSAEKSKRHGTFIPFPLPSFTVFTPIREVHRAIEILEKFTLFSRSGEDLMSSPKVVNRVIHAEEQLSKKQSTINAYFRKEK